ncbi:MAG: hypothetical protein EP343_21250 [Deltaproteobacteria bacterium]|nr:MAG: hypothetical protein EP343_21250 [Deltaproteobacteria bacterium]
MMKQHTTSSGWSWKSGLALLVMGLVLAALAAPVLVSCGPGETGQESAAEATDDAGDTKDTSTSEGTSEVKEVPGTQVMMNVEGTWNTPKTFFDFPYPSDARLDSNGAPDVTGFPNPEENVQVKALLPVVGKRKGFPLVPMAFFRFNEAPAKAEESKVILGTKDAVAFLVDVDESSKNWGKLYPVIANRLQKGTYVPTHLLAVSVLPGIVLEGNRKYAFVLMRSFNNDKGEPLGVPLALEQLKAGVAPKGAVGDKLLSLYQPLWKTLEKVGVDKANVAAATVFSTGDVVADMERISSALLKKYKPEITNLRLDPDDGDHPRYCEVLAKIVQPQFQKGTPPFDTEGLFEYDKDGIPIKQRDKELPVVITIPKKAMPKEGFPLMMYVHGSGGLSSQAVDRGKVTSPRGRPAKGEGPSHVVADIGVGTVCTAMPVNPERVPGASSIAYLNIQNLAAFHDLFRQGVIEARILLDAMLRLRIDPKSLGKCGEGITLPQGETQIKFSDKRMSLMGQSMGAMYTNMIGAVEPRFKLLIPTGAGGLWSFFAFNSNVQLLQEPLLRSLLQSTETLTFTHPAMHLMQTAWETSEPAVYLPRLSRLPFPGHDPRHVYQPMGEGDSFFREPVLDVMALGYNNQQAGVEVWPGTQAKLKTMGLEGLATYPVKLNRKSADGKDYTGVAVQYKADTVSRDGHMIAFQVDDVVFQYKCFLDSFLKTGTAVVPAPGKLDSPCPTP